MQKNFDRKRSIWSNVAKDYSNAEKKKMRNQKLSSAQKSKLLRSIFSFRCILKGHIKAHISNLPRDTVSPKGR